MQKQKLNEIRHDATRCVDCPIRARALFQVVADEYLQDAESRRTGQYRLQARHTLFQEDVPATMAYTVFDGWLMLYRTHSDGSRQGLRIALPGDFVGYTPLGDANYSHSALAVTDAVLCGFRQHDLHAIIDSDPDIARQIAAIQAGYLSTCESNVLGLGRKTAEQRIAFAIADLYFRLCQIGVLDDGAREMPLPLTQEMLGDLTGLTPVHTNRVLRKLRTDGVLSCERQRADVLDLERLAAIGEFRMPRPD